QAGRPDVRQHDLALDAAAAHAADVLHGGDGGRDGEVGLRVQRVGDAITVQRDAPVAIVQLAAQGEVDRLVDLRFQVGVVVDDRAGRDAALEQLGYGGIAHRLAV